MGAFTRGLIDHPVCADLKAAGAPLGVATGVNDCAASVGLFGPDQDYTAFSSGMNNTARLQGMAVRDEVLVMEPMKEVLERADLGLRFGPRREGKAKNVAEPLVFYAVDPASVT
jgi:class 3 adenylate cyclase